MSDDPFDSIPPIGAEPDAPAPREDDPFSELLAQGASYDLNDNGNARRFALYFGENLIWVPRMGWYVWDGTRWARDKDEIEVKRLCQELGDLVKREVWTLRLGDRQMDLIEAEQSLIDEREGWQAATDDQGKLTADAEARIRQINVQLAEIGKLKKSLSDIRAAHRRFAIQAGNGARMKSMREEAGVKLSRRLDDLDAQPLELNTLSGVVRFTVDREDGRRYANVELMPHARAQLHTKIMPVRYEADCADPPECPQFDAFLARIQPDPVMRQFLMRSFALAMTRLIEQKLWFLYGMGANGKSVLVDLMARIAGDYAATAKIESLTGTNRRGGGDATPDLVPLIGARMVRAAEPDEGMRWQEGLIKDLTGGEPILVRALHSDFVEVRPCFSLFISGNHKPDIRGTDDGIWRRLMLVPFDVQIPKDEQIPKRELDDILFAERDGIFRQLVGYLGDYLERGLREPDKVLEATSEFREESDPYGAFLEDACVVSGNPEDTIEARELVLCFHFWMMSRGEGAFKDRTVALALADRSRRWASKRTGQKFTARKSGGTKRYDGIRLSDLFAREWGAAHKDAQGRAIAPNSGGDSGAQGAF
ncbi:DNA primase family protein [Roseinatronobacter bogoriensis]|uniref:DNA primase family protein n=1 Tax=Roseinatronobacter bogoriensis TaxID=119542 RepID=UPI0010664F5C|nr:DNA primase family protein [Rhodobaca bogoriensis]MBB4207265.1 putative DNA primase/helicase [Rhodobaca bogoriensis DSM 18756]TDY65764.1 putative DNA primase/helicase [Rhodobaca bogoriensis DSM 18756]